MKSYQISQIGAIFFFLGATLLMVSWYNSYPIQIGALDELTFSQFSLLTWPGILFSSIGLFLTGYFSARNSVKAICASLFPLIIYIHMFYFSGTSSGDIGNVKSMFEVFRFTGIDSSIVPYFQYPVYFTVNDVTAKITGLEVNSIAMIYFALYGVLLGLYLYLFLFKFTKFDSTQIALLGVFIYFSISILFLNYQWVPQTLALVIVFLLLLIFNLKDTKYKFLTLLFFIVLIFTHVFIPVIFLLFYGFYSMKKRESLRLFVIMVCLYTTVLVYYTTYFFPQIVSAFSETIYGFGEYSSSISQSFKETTNFFDQLISLINRTRFVFTLLIIIVGFFVGVIKKKIHYIVITLGIVGGIYLSLGLFYSILGLRALQILMASLVVGIGFFILKMKKPTSILVSILIILSIFGPIRYSFDQTLFITNEEENTCRFLSSSISQEKTNYIAVDQVDWGYITNIANYVTKANIMKIRPARIQFYEIFNTSMKNQNYIIYNSNLGKEVRDQGIVSNYEDYISKTIILNNKIYSCGKTFIFSG